MSQNTTLTSNDFQEEAGKIVSKSLLPAYVLLSFLTSIIGAWTTLELLNRRTSSKGSYNWSLLAGAAISLGGIGIWCMHFIGCRAIVLGNGAIELQIIYSGSFTALSFFFPIIVIFMALAAVGSNDKVDFVRLVLGGTLAGLGVCGMHYVGQAGITNYDCIYEIDYVIGSAIIAVVDANVALGMFFYFRALWKASWWKRGMCALILAGAVSGMHWLALAGTQYRLKQDATFATNSPRNATIIGVIVLSVSGCFILFASAIVAKAQKKRAANRATQITLISAIFDADGRLLVKGNGLLPTKKVTAKYRDQNFNDVFDIAHPAFLWIYRASRNWEGISSIVPAMREHLHRSGIRNRLGIDSEAKFESEEGTPVAEYSIIFRELFCAAAAELSDDMKMPLDKLGHMFDEIIYSGKKPAHGKNDLELGAGDALGKGQLLFLIRVAGQNRAKQLQSAGYRFAPAANIIERMTGIFQIPRDDMLLRFDIMRECAMDPPIREPGCHLVLFACRASMVHGFDILCRRDARNLLPAMQLPFDTWEAWMSDYIIFMESKTVAACMKLLNKDRASKETSIPQKRKKFAAHVLHTLEALKDQIEDPIFNDAMLIGHPVKAPCRGPTPDSHPGIATLLCFRMIIPIQTRAPGSKLDFTPLTFFKQQQHVYKNSVSHAAFARRAYKEFTPVLNLSVRASVDGDRQQHEIDAEDRAIMYAIQKTPSGEKHKKGGYFGLLQKAQRNDKVKDPEDQGVGSTGVNQEKASLDLASKPPSIADSTGKMEKGVELMDMKREPIAEEAPKEKERDWEVAARYVEELFAITVRRRTIH